MLVLWGVVSAKVGMAKPPHVFGAQYLPLSFFTKLGTMEEVTLCDQDVLLQSKVGHPIC